MRLSKKILALNIIIAAAIVFSIVYTFAVGHHYTMHTNAYLPDLDEDSVRVTYDSEDVVRFTGAHLSESGLQDIREIVLEFEAIKKGKTHIAASCMARFDGETLPFDITADTVLTVTSTGLIFESEGMTVNFQSYPVLLIVLMIILAVSLVILLIAFIDHLKNGDFNYVMIAGVGSGIFFSILLAFLLYKWANNALRFFSAFITAFLDIGIELLLLIAPLMLLLSVLLAISNIRLLMNEGFRPVNALGIAFAVLCVIGIALSVAVDIPFVRDIVDPGIVQRSILYLFCYFGAMFLATVVCAFLSTRYRPPYDRSYIIILGCGIRADGTLTPLLKGRVDAALAFEKEQFEKTGKHAVFVPSGGQGSDEVISESQAMTNYLLEQGVETDRILMEDKSVNTFQNMQFSKQMIEQHAADFDNCKIAFSTTNYHIFRGYIYARKNGFDAKGISAKTKYYFYPNAFLREFIGLLVDRKFSHIAFVAVTLIVFVFFDNLGRIL